MSNNDNDDDDSRRDLTRIEDLSEFLHEEDPELEDLFGGFNEVPATSDKTSTEAAAGVSLDELDEAPPELPDSTVSEMNFGDPEAETEEETEPEINLEPEETSTEEIEALDDSPFSLSDDALEEPNEEVTDNFSFDLSEPEAETEPEIEPELESEPEEIEHTRIAPHYQDQPQEKFEEVKNFAQNFSYGQIVGGGNPPFSLIVRNLKYQSDAEDIIILLREFGIVTDANLAETERALELGSLLVPQISEYSAIVLAHKLRRYDCDLEVGLSDEVHPSKSGETNPKGLMKKGSLRQNITESYRSDEDDTPAKVILVSTTATLEGYSIKKFIGVQTSFAIVDEDELERLKFVQKAARENSDLHQYETDDKVTSERAFRDYQNSFEVLFTDLCDQLKMKAMKEKANALIGLSYQLTAMPFEKSASGASCYQLLCSATLAVVKAE